MISSYEELEKFITQLNLGSTTVKVSVGTRSIVLSPEPNPSKVNLSQSKDWLEYLIGHNIGRQFDYENKTWKIKHSTMTKMRESLAISLLEAITKCSNSKMPERTSLYKDYRSIILNNSNNSQFMTDIIGILNYYNASRTDATCKSNVIGLLDLLRKKYGKPSR